MSRAPSNQIGVPVPRWALVARPKAKKRRPTKKAEFRILNPEPRVPNPEPRLKKPIDDAPIPIDLPGLNPVEVISLQEVLGRYSQHLCRFADRWLHLALFVRAARLQHGFLAV